MKTGTLALAISLTTLSFGQAQELEFSQEFFWNPYSADRYALVDYTPFKSKDLKFGTLSAGMAFGTNTTNLTMVTGVGLSWYYEYDTKMGVNPYLGLKGYGFFEAGSKFALQGGVTFGFKFYPR